MQRHHNGLPISLLEMFLLAAIYLLADAGLKAIGIDKETLPALPVVKQAWVGFSVIIFILVWLVARKTDLREFGLKTPRPYWLVLPLGVAGVIVAIVVSSATTPIIEAQFGPTNTSAFENIKGNLNLFLFTVPFIWLFAAFGEEFFYRAFLMTGIAQLLGGGRVAWIIALGAQAILFGLGHSYQGVSGMIGTGLYGLVYGILFLAARRNIWAPMIAHGLLDTLAFTLLFLGAIEA